MNILEDKIENNQIDEAINLIEEIGRNKCLEYVSLLIKYLESTNNGNLRNSIALALSDMGSSEAIEPIIHLLKNPITIGNRGTLLAALEPFDYSSYIEMLVEFLYEGNFEVSRKSFTLIEAIAKDIPEDIKQKSIKKVKYVIENLQEKVDFLSESMEMLMNKEE